jgi:hypothetical protein
MAPATAMPRSNQVAGERWVLRSEVSRPARVYAMSGAVVYGVSEVRGDGCVEVVLGDGIRVRAHSAVIVAE